MLCTHCWATQIKPYKDVSKYWNNPSDTSYVCSKTCFDELMESLENGTWMDWNPRQKKNIPKRSNLDGKKK